MNGATAVRQFIIIITIIFYFLLAKTQGKRVLEKVKYSKSCTFSCKENNSMPFPWADMITEAINLKYKVEVDLNTEIFRKRVSAYI